jgi:hypothetical protein
LYSSEGFVVGWNLAEKGPAAPEAALSVEVWQALIKGKKPEHLSGASDDALKVVPPPEECPSPNTAYTASAPETINGRRYWGRALDFMKERKISSEEVERAISLGKRDERGERVMIYYHDPQDVSGVGLNWLRLTKSGDVTLIG